MSEVDPKKVFVVHGRNLTARDAMFTFLRAIGLDPIEWSTAIGATGSGAPFIGQALDAAFAMAKSVVVLLTPDDVAYLRPEYASGDDDPETEPKGQARPNVLFEAGMALGHHPDRTIIVELGSLRPFSDVAGRHLIRMDGSAPKRNELANRLRNAGCAVNTTNTDWLIAGDFTPPPTPGGPMGRRVPSNSQRRKRRLDGRFLYRSAGSSRIQITNIGAEDVFDLTSPNAGRFHGHLDDVEVPRLPAGKSVSLIAAQMMGGPDTFDLIVNGRTESGEEFSESLFLDLNS
ncbi:TIR domain-containing protein [Mycobacterium sp. GA-2829]|uniref:TIR domain-containing protein n=1 Tax=Mycobacterium sp. GA-2829 TaxID=1772283 RepID=UPI0018D25C22|nr:nucleotide-binding protein [Mycobacterium sp. GA-2829]